MKRMMVAVSGIFVYVVISICINFYHKVYPVSNMNQDINTQLIQYIENNQIEPIDPRIDPIFHFVPGLKGLEIDYGLSYNNMIANGAFDEALVVHRSIDYKKDPEQFRSEPMYKGNEKGDYVSLLINVAWGEDELEEMINILDRLDVKATFFFEGRYAEEHQEQVLKIHEKGHLIGNHSYSHPARWGTYTYDQYKEEIVKTNDVLTSITGEKMAYFAPPGGEFNDKTVKAAFDQGMYTILWTADTIDWKGSSAETILNRVMNKVEPGALILMHPKPETVIALEPIITNLRDSGYEFKTVEQMVTGERPGVVN